VLYIFRSDNDNPT